MLRNSIIVPKPLGISCYTMCTLYGKKPSKRLTFVAQLCRTSATITPWFVLHFERLPDSLVRYFPGYLRFLRIKLSLLSTVFQNLPYKFEIGLTREETLFPKQEYTVVVPQVFRCMVTTCGFRFDIRRNDKYALIQKSSMSVTWEAVLMRGDRPE